MKTPKIIETLAEKIMEAHKKRVAEDSMQKYLEENLRDTEKAISNLISCMEQGIVSNSTKQRLLELSCFTLLRNCKERGNILTHACGLFVLPCDGIAIVRTRKLLFFYMQKSAIASPIRLPGVAKKTSGLLVFSLVPLSQPQLNTPLHILL